MQKPYEGYFEELARLLHPQTFAEESYAMMYGCYLDESFDMKQSGFYVVGGFITQGIAVFELDRQWEKLLKRHKLAYFKASQCESGKGEFRKFVSDPKKITDKERDRLTAISHEFCRLIGNPVAYDSRGFLSLYGVAVVQKDFYHAIKTARGRGVLGDNPYRLAYDLAMIQAAWTMKELGKRKPMHCVSFICDADEEHAEIAPAAYLKLKKKSPKAAQFMCSYSMEDEKLCRPLQAADAVVYEIRKVLKYAAKDWETRIRSQFDIFTDRQAMFYMGTTNAKQLKWIVENHKPGEAFKLDKLMSYRLKENVDNIRV